MKTMVTGGAGFIGSHLCEALITIGDHVTCLDDLSTGALSNVEHLLNHPRFTFVNHDITKPVATAEKVDAIAHLASPASPVDYHAAPIATLMAGSRGTENALEMARTSRARFVLASTSEVYGDPDQHPQSECYNGNVNPIGPRSVYDEAKRFSEALSVAYRRSLDLDAGIVRIFNTYGPRMRESDGRVVSTFIVQALNNQPITVQGNGSQTRSLCYVDDLVAGIVAMLRNHEPGPINLGRPEETTVIELARTIRRITASSSTIEHLPLPADDPVRRKPSIRRAHDRLGWSPATSQSEGLRRTVEAFRARSSANDEISQPPSPGPAALDAPH